MDSHTPGTVFSTHIDVYPFYVVGQHTTLIYHVTHVSYVAWIPDADLTERPDVLCSCARTSELLCSKHFLWIINAIDRVSFTSRTDYMNMNMNGVSLCEQQGIWIYMHYLLPSVTFAALSLFFSRVLMDTANSLLMSVTQTCHIRRTYALCQCFCGFSWDRLYPIIHKKES